MTTSWGLLEQEGHSRVESDGRIVNEYTESYIYKTDAMTRPTKQDILADMGATPGSPYFDDVKATLYDATVRGYGEKTRPPHLQFLVILQWSTGATLPASTDPDPTTRRTIWTVKPIIQQRFVIKDRNDDLIINTAGQTPDGGVPVDVRMGTVVATRNVTAVGYNRNTVLANSGKLNSVTYLGGDPGTVQVDIESVETFQGAYHFYAETYTFSYDPRGMQPHFASAGFSAINDAGQLAKILLEDGSQPSEPEPLDTAGKWVPIADRPSRLRDYGSRLFRRNELLFIRTVNRAGPFGITDRIDVRNHYRCDSSCAPNDAATAADQTPQLSHTKRYSGPDGQRATLPVLRLPEVRVERQSQYQHMHGVRRLCSEHLQDRRWPVD